MYIIKNKFGMLMPIIALKYLKNIPSHANHRSCVPRSLSTYDDFVIFGHYKEQICFKYNEDFLCSAPFSSASDPVVPSCTR